jgi:predicted O-methyltransferase YrrM
MGRPVTLDEQLRAYLLTSQPSEHEEQRKLREFTSTMPKARLQIAPEQGHLLTFLLRLTGASELLELGTFTGYSALTMALALPADGHLLTCDNNVEWAVIGRPYWERAGVSDKIDLRVGPAIETLNAIKQTQAGCFDFIFIDANKDQYDDYYEASLMLVRPGGLIVLDNMLLRGRVVVVGDRDPWTIAIRNLNEKIAGDRRVDYVLLAIGDGMTFARRRM